MKHIKQWHRVAVAAVLSLMWCVNVGAYDFSADNIYYTINEKTLTAEVTYASESYNSYSGQVVIPATVENDGKTYAVAAVGDNAFRDCTELTDVIFGSNVTTIGKRAFLNCSSLTTVTIAEGVTEIGDYAFAQCGGLKIVTMDNDAPLQVGSGAFLRCTSLQSVKWQSSETLEGRGGITSVGTSAFAHCTSLTSIKLPGEIQHLGITIFDGCTSMQGITVTTEQPLVLSGDPFALDSSVKIFVPSSGKSGETASRYRNATGWRNYKIIELSYSFIDNNRYTYRKTSAGAVSLTGAMIAKSEVVVRDNIKGNSGETYYVTAIGNEAFKGTSTNTLNTGNAHHLKSIGAESFADCANLTNVSLIEGIASMGERAFASCTALTTIRIPSTLRIISTGAFDGCTSLTDVTLLLGVCVLSENAFANCTSLTTLNLPSSISSVEAYAFNGATALKKIIVAPNNPWYATIDDVLYERKENPNNAPELIDKMDKLVVYPSSKTGEKLYIPPGVTEILAGAIQNATNLKRVAIPPTTTIFGDNCFEGTSIQSINYRCKSPTNDGTSGITATLTANATLQVPIGTSADYQALSAWQGFKAITERYDVCSNDKFIYDWNDRDYATLVDIKPAAVDASGKLTLPLWMTLNNRNYVITELSNTSTAQVAQLVKSLIINCDSLAIIDLTNDINPLAALTSLETISISPTNAYFKLVDNVLYNRRGSNLYYYLRSKPQESFTLPFTVDTIMPQAFAQNNNLKVLTSNTYLKYIHNRSFEGCTALESVENLKNVNYIGHHAFAGCTALANIAGGERINTIDKKAFLNCSNLKQFPFCHGLLVDIGSHAFMGCSSLTVAVFSNTLSKIGEGAFENCTALSKVFFTGEVNELAPGIFKGCTSLAELWLSNIVPMQVGNDFFAPSANITLYVPQGATNAYHTTAPWSSASQVNVCHYLDNGPDVNNDKAVNAYDVTVVYSVLLGNTEDFIVGHCDVNHDGAVTAADITAIYDYILTGSNVSMDYRFQEEMNDAIGQYISLDGVHYKIRAIDHSTDNFVTSGLLGVSDHPQVATITLGSSQSIPYLEIVPVSTGYFTLVAIVSNGTASFYRAFPLVVQ